MRLARRLLVALWAGLLLSIGAVVAPALFAVLADRHLAGAIAGHLFLIVTVLSAAVAAALAVLAALEQGPATRARQLTAAGPAILLAGSEWLVRPLIEAARATHGVDGRAFAIWHGVSSGLYWLATIWVVVALVRELRA